MQWSWVKHSRNPLAPKKRCRLSSAGTVLVMFFGGLLAYKGQLSVEDIVAFGDNYNDVEMLEAAGKGFIMANASADLLARFPLHSEGDNDHDGIYHTLKKLNMI